MKTSIFIQAKSKWLIASFIALYSIGLPTLGELQTQKEALDQVATYSAKIKKQPEQAELYVTRGDAYYLLHEYDEAIKDFTTAINLDKSLDDAYFGRGMAYGRYGLIDEGEGNWTESISIQ